MARELVTRSSDGATIDLAKQEAEQAHLTARAKRAILIDTSANEITSSNPLPVSLSTGDIEIGAVEIKNATDDTRAVVKSDGTNNALVVVQNTVPITTVQATNLDIRDLISTQDSVEVKQATGTNLHTVLDSGTVTSITNTVTVQATDLDIRNLSSASDSITATISGTPNVAVTSFPDNEPFNLAQYGGSAVGATNALHTQAGTGAVFPVNDNSGSLTVDGTVTANAGTNLNTSALSLETTSTSIKNAVEIIDNFISGSRGLVTEDNSSSIKTAVELIDDTVYTDGVGTPSKAIGIAGTDGTNPQIIKTDISGELQVDVLSMPTTTVTATNLDIRDLTSISDSVSAVQSGTWNINNVSGTVSLPTGASTSANQSTEITHLSNIATSTGIMDDWDNTASDGASVSGDVAHDSVDAGEPVKIGAKSIDYKPDTTGEQGQTSVAANDRTNLSANLKGELVTSVKAEYNSLNNIGTTYNNVTTTATSQNIVCWQYRECTVSYELDKANTPTDLTFEIQESLDGTNFVKKTIPGFLQLIIYDDTAVGTGRDESISFPISSQLIRVKVTAVGTDATNTFTVANPFIYLRT